MRIGQLLRDCGLDFEALTAAANQLAERRRINIEWRPPALPPGLPERVREVARPTTRFGRFRHPMSWSTRHGAKRANPLSPLAGRGLG
jgi:hypothetical protein